MLREGQNVLRPFAQRRNEHGKDIDAVVKIFAEQPLLHQFFQRAVGGADKAHVHLVAAFIAKRLDFAFLKRAQHLCLCGGGEVADFVQKQRALVCLAEKAGTVLHRACERALAPAKKLAFNEFRGQGGAVEHDQRLRAPRACCVQGLGHQFFAHARLPAQQHGCAAGPSLREAAQHVPQALGGGNDRGWRAADKRFIGQHAEMLARHFFLQTRHLSAHKSGYCFEKAAAQIQFRFWRSGGIGAQGADNFRLVGIFDAHRHADECKPRHFFLAAAKKAVLKVWPTLHA